MYTYPCSKKKKDTRGETRVGVQISSPIFLACPTQVSKNSYPSALGQRITFYIFLCCRKDLRWFLSTLCVLMNKIHQYPQLFSRTSYLSWMQCCVSLAQFRGLRQQRAGLLCLSVWAKTTERNVGRKHKCFHTHRMKEKSRLEYCNM